MTSPPVAARGDFFFRPWGAQILIYVLNKIGVRETHMQEVTVWDR